jgi:hypothetical protein
MTAPSFYALGSQLFLPPSGYDQAAHGVRRRNSIYDGIGRPDEPTFRSPALHAARSTGAGLSSAYDLSALTAATAALGLTSSATPARPSSRGYSDRLDSSRGATSFVAPASNSAYTAAYGARQFGRSAYGERSLIGDASFDSLQRGQNHGLGRGFGAASADPYESDSPSDSLSSIFGSASSTSSITTASPTPTFASLASVPTFLCDQCGDIFSCATDLDTHRRAHLDGDIDVTAGKPYQVRLTAHVRQNDEYNEW